MEIFRRFDQTWVDLLIHERRLLDEVRWELFDSNNPLLLDFQSFEHGVIQP